MTTHMITIPDCPKSMNAGGSSRHRMVAYREKKRWQELMELEMQIAKIPKGMLYCAVDIVVRWKKKIRRDSTNYYHPIVKPLADAMVRAKYLPDDTDEFFRVAGLRFEYPENWEWKDPRLKASLIIRFDATYP